MTPATRRVLEMWVRSTRETDAGDLFEAVGLAVDASTETTAILMEDTEPDLVARSLLVRWDQADHIGPVREAIVAYHEALDATLPVLAATAPRRLS